MKNRQTQIEGRARYIQIESWGSEIQIWGRHRQIQIGAGAKAGSRKTQKKNTGLNLN